MTCALSTPKGSDAKPISGEGVLIELVQAPDAYSDVKDALKKVGVSFWGAAADGASWEDVMAPDAIMIRPSGNPMDKALWAEMTNSEEIVAHSHELVALNKYNLVGDVAWAVATTHSKFSFHGKEDDDIAVYSLILQKIEGEWKVAHAHRSTGRKPDEELPNFD